MDCHVRAARSQWRCVILKPLGWRILSCKNHEMFRLCLNMTNQIFGGAISIAHRYENRIPSATKVAPPKIPNGLFSPRSIYTHPLPPPQGRGNHNVSQSIGGSWDTRNDKSLSCWGKAETSHDSCSPLSCWAYAKHLFGFLQHEILQPKGFRMTKYHDAMRATKIASPKIWFVMLRQSRNISWLTTWDSSA